MTTSDSIFYKFLTPQGTGGYSHYVWPKQEWTPLIEYAQPLVRCERGYHVLTSDQLFGNYMQAELWRVDVAGEIVWGDDKVIVRQARLGERIETWNDQTARLFACDSAEQVLPLFQKRYPNDQRPFQAIECARRFANGNATFDELNAAMAAAGDAVRDAAWATAMAAVWDAAAWAAARAAARDAAGDAIWDAAMAAAWAAERKWQKERLVWYLKLAA